MSRSRKHNRVFKFKWLGKYGKKIANRKVRHSVVSNYGNYKKLFETWDIYEYVLEDFKKEKTDDYYAKLYERK